MSAYSRRWGLYGGGASLDFRRTALATNPGQEIVVLHARLPQLFSVSRLANFDNRICSEPGHQPKLLEWRPQPKSVEPGFLPPDDIELIDIAAFLLGGTSERG